MKKPRNLNEGWVHFIRMPCRSGSIDRWIGDSANDPNNEDESVCTLNIFAQFYRLNRKGKWITDRDFERRFFKDLGELREHFSSDDIWRNYLTQSSLATPSN